MASSHGVSRGLLVWVVAAAAIGLSVAAEEFRLQEIFIRVPPETPGFVPTPGLAEELQGLYRIEGWIKTRPDSLISHRHSTLEGPPFDTMRKLLKAYRDRDPEQFLALHPDEAREAMAANFGDPALRRQWTEFVGTIESLEPEILWVAGEQIGSIVKLHCRDATSGELSIVIQPFVWDRDFLLAGKPLGSDQTALVSNLMWFFTDPERANEARSLVVNLDYLSALWNQGDGTFPAP